MTTCSKKEIRVELEKLFCATVKVLVTLLEIVLHQKKGKVYSNPDSAKWKYQCKKCFVAMMILVALDWLQNV